MRFGITKVLLALLLGILLQGVAVAEDEKAPSVSDVKQKLKLAASYFRNQVAVNGGYVYFCSEDLTERWGEGKATDSMIVVQPPATPSVGESYLRAYAVTGDSFFLDAAREAGEALVYGQLRSGGWTQVIHFEPPESGRMGAYRKSKGGRLNNSSLDDDQTQAALRFLAKLDKALNFKHAEIHEATLFGLNALLEAQFACGAFPQVWTGPVEDQPILQANYPKYDWRAEGRIKEYWNYYTLNDGLAGTVAETLILAHQVYGDEKYQRTLKSLGDFLIRAQMPSPQPAWCQQYNYNMQPMWARKFEPPAITGGESQDVMRTLIEIANYTGVLKYLEPIPAAVNYFEQNCMLPDGKLARYYELQANRPLYMDSKYELTYDAGDAPSHYSWTVSANFKRIKDNYRKLKNGQKLRNERKISAVFGSGRGDESRTNVQTPSSTTDGLVTSSTTDGLVTSSTTTINALSLVDTKKRRGVDPKRVREVVEQLDEQGRWVSRYEGQRLVGQPKFPIGFRYIASDVFNENIAVLCDFLESSE